MKRKSMIVTEVLDRDAIVKQCQHQLRLGEFICDRCVFGSKSVVSDWFCKELPTMDNYTS